MQTIYIKSAGFNVNPTQQSVFKMGNKGYVLTRGINIILINNSNAIQHNNYDTYAINLEQTVMECLKQAYENTSINTILFAVHDDCVGAISVSKLQQLLSFLNIQSLKFVKFRYSYLFTFDNKNKRIITEELSQNQPIEKSYLYDLNNHRLFVTNTKYICCTKWMYKYFIEYIESFMKTLDLKLILADDLNALTYDPNAIYIFCQSIPEKVIDTSINKILINTEQVTNLERKEPCLAALKRNIPVIDYAPENIQVFNNSLVNYLPYQHTTEIHKLYTFLNIPKQYDVAFCGTLSSSPKRKVIIDQLISKGIDVHIVDGWGDNRDKEIGKCKILLNIHFHDTYNVYESLRVCRWVMAGMLVISETSLNNNILDIANLVLFEPYNNLISKVIEVIKNYDHYQTEFVKKHAASINQLKTNRQNQMVAVKNKLGL